MTSLALLQLVSPALPVGAFSYSEGLEVLIQSGVLADAEAVHHWLVAELKRGSLRVEAAALGSLSQDLAAWLRGDASARQRLLERDAWLLAMRDAAELRAQQRQMGMSLLQLLDEMGHALPEPLALGWPAAWAWAAHALQVPESEMVEGYLYGWVANQLSAAVRLLPMGPSRAQVLQQRLLPLIAQQAEQLRASDPQELWCSGVGAGLAQLAHADLYTRLFRS